MLSIGQTFNSLLTATHWARYTCRMFVKGSLNQQISREQAPALVGSGPETVTGGPKLLSAFVFVLSAGAGGR